MNTLNETGKAFIKSKEALKLVAYPDPGSELADVCRRCGYDIYNNGYQDLAGWKRYSGDPWTIGYGQTGHAITAGTRWTEEEAEKAFEATCYFLGVNILRKLNKAELSDNAFSALVSFAYNAGMNAFYEVCNETHLQSGTENAKLAFVKKMLSYNKNHGTFCSGLANRRKWEADLFLKA